MKIVGLPRPTGETPVKVSQKQKAVKLIGESPVKHSKLMKIVGLPRPTGETPVKVSQKQKAVRLTGESPAGHQRLKKVTYSITHSISPVLQFEKKNLRV